MHLECIQLHRLQPQGEPESFSQRGNGVEGEGITLIYPAVKQSCPAPTLLSSNLYFMMWIVLIGAAVVFQLIGFRAFGFLLRWLYEMLFPMLFYDWMKMLVPDVAQSRAQWMQAWSISFLRSRFMRFIGAISLSFYLIHIIVLQCLKAFRMSALVQLLVGFPLSLILGWILTEYFEEPAALACLPSKQTKQNNALPSTVVEIELELQAPPQPSFISA